jgi:beta-galactosidase
LEYCSWSNIPDIDFAMAEDHDWTLGQFVWTGFDYLGEPSPYDTDAWPNHSSMFGIIDLANIPKDRYYLYRSLWNKNENTLHIVPHWTWTGREGEVTPIFVYTNFPSAEVFINGKSQGKKTKNYDGELTERYRLMWNNTVYEAGEVKVIAYDENGKAVMEKIVRTAGKPHHIELIPNKNVLIADGKDLIYINVRIVDEDGNLCPHDKSSVSFSVKGTGGKFRAAANGDPTCLELFHLPKMTAFNGQLTAIVQSSETAGNVVFEANVKGLKSGKISFVNK